MAGLVFLLFLVRKTLFVFALALFLGLMIAPLTHALERLARGHLPRTASIAAAFLLVIAAVVAGTALVGPTLSAQGAQLVERLPALAASANSVDPVALPSFLEPWRERLGGIVKQLVAGATASAIPFASSVVHALLATATNLVYLVIIPILSFLFLKDGAMLVRARTRWLPPDKQRQMARIGEDVYVVLGNYVRTLGLLSLATFIAYGGFFLIVGVPFGVLLAALAAILEFIPVIGPLTAVGLVLLVALIAGYQHLLWLAMFFIAYRVFQDYILSPRLMGAGVGLSPAMVIFGFLAGEQLAGIPGMFLAIPVIAALRIVLASIESSESASAQ